MILKVSELSRQLKTHIESEFSSIEVQGEISGFKKHTSGHSYFALKDDEAVLDAVCWRGTKLSLALEEGLEIIAKGRITTYMGRSKYQMIVESVKASGEGALMKLLLERKERFLKEGLFAQKRPLPSFPTRIGIITSATGAVIQDILHRLEERYPCHVILCSVLVQGQGANQQVTQAIEMMNQLTDNRPDVLIIARGGGSIEDLWTFNEEEVARAAFASSIPIISAIGHETDFTLLDFVADLRAPTPTAAAELATPVLSQIVEDARYKTERIFSRIFYMMDHYVLHLNRLVCRHPKHHLEDLQLRFDDWCERFLQTPKLMWAFYEKRLTFSMPHPKDRIHHAFENLSHAWVSLQKAWEGSLQNRYEHCKRFAICLDVGSPHRVLERGFCWVTHQGKMITQKKSMEDVLPGELNLRFHDGALSIQGKI